MSIRFLRDRKNDADLLRVLADAVDDERADAASISVDAQLGGPVILTVDVAIKDENILKWLSKEISKGS